MSLTEVADFYRTVLDELHGEDGEMPSDVEAVVHAYTESDCWDMALALMQVSGLPGVLVTTAAGATLHACVATESGDFLDASGCHTAKEMGRRHGLRKPHFLAASRLRIENYDGHADEEDRREAQIRALSVIPHLPAFQGYPWAQAEVIAGHVHALPGLAAPGPACDVPHIPKEAGAGALPGLQQQTPKVR